MYHKSLIFVTLLATHKPKTIFNNYAKIALCYLKAWVPYPSSPQNKERSDYVLRSANK